MGKHSIKNPDSFSDCIEMLLSGVGNHHLEYNFDILSERCFHLEYESNIKTWIHTKLSVEESVQNLFSNAGIVLDIIPARNLSYKDLLYVAKQGAVFGPIERHTFNQAVEDMYFLGGKHFVYLADIIDECIVLHDPDSSPCILVDVELFQTLLQQEDIYCITYQKEVFHYIDYKEIIKRNLMRSKIKVSTITLPTMGKGIGTMASFRYGLRLYLFYQKEILDLIDKQFSSEVLKNEINDFFKYATEGYNRCEWDYFLSIIEKFNDLVCKVTDVYV